MQNRAPRCGHGFYEMLCVLPWCEHYDGGQQEAPPARSTRKPAYRGASAAVHAILLETPQLSNADVAALCGCSKSLVGQVRTRLGLMRRQR